MTFAATGNAPITLPPNIPDPPVRIPYAANLSGVPEFGMAFS